VVEEIVMQKGIVAAVVALLIAAAVAWFLLRPKPVPPPPPAPAEQPAPQKPADAPLPPAGESDAQVRKALAGVTLRPELQKWLAGAGDLLDRWAVIADNLAEDVSPRKQLAFLAPAKKFTVIEKRGKIQLDLSSYQRYDLFAEVVASVDAKSFAAAVRELHPLLEAAYHKLGYPERKLDEVAQKALRRLAEAPVAEGPVALVSSGALYKFKDQKLEAQGPVEKHLLRMGPRNTKLIQAKAREIMSALRP
jgi:hypothetical protein